MVALVDGIHLAVLEHRWVRTMVPLLRAWEQAKLEDTRVGTRRLEAAVDAMQAERMPVLEPLGLLLLARARRRAGEDGAALRAGEPARAIAQRQFQVLAPEALHLCGLLLEATGADPSRVTALLRAAVATAKLQGAVVNEARARTSLVQWLRRSSSPDSTAEQHELDALFGRITGLRQRA